MIHVLIPSQVSSAHEVVDTTLRRHNSASGVASSSLLSSSLSSSSLDPSGAREKSDCDLRGNYRSRKILQLGALQRNLAEPDCDQGRVLN